MKGECLIYKFLLVFYFFIGFSIFMPTLAAGASGQSDPARVSERIKEVSTPSPTQAPSQVIVEEPVTPVYKVSKKEPQFLIRNIQVVGSSVYTDEQLQKLYQEYLKKPVSLAILNQIADKITLKYRQDGYITSYAVVPAQRIKNGVAEIKVIEGYVDNIIIEGKVRYAQKTLEAYGQYIKNSRPLNMKILERYVLLANDLPGISAKTVISASTTKPGASDITMIVQQKTFAADISFNNYGTRYIGPEQFITNISANSILGVADQIGLHGAITPNVKQMKYGELTYKLPLGSRGLVANASINHTLTNPKFLLSPLDLEGSSTSWNVGLSYPLLRTREQSVYMDAGFKWLNSDCDSPATTYYRDRIRAIHAQMSYILSDKFHGFNILTAQIVKGLSGLGASSANSGLLSRGDGKSNFVKYNFYLSRDQVINQRFSLLFAGSAQYTRDQLLAAEEFGVGGRVFGSGYDPSEIIGDKGIAGKVELRFNTYPIPKYIPLVQYYTFYSVGKIWNIGAVSSTDKADTESLASMGLGIRTNITDHINASVELAKPLTRSVRNLIDDSKNGNAIRCFFNLTMVF